MNTFTDARACAGKNKKAGAKIKYIIRRIKNKIKYADKTAAAAVTGCILLLASPQVSVAAARKGMELWWDTVVPSLLPFFIFTDMLMAAGVHKRIGHALQGPVSFLLGVPGQAAFVFVSSILSGYPVGARIIAEMRRSGSITREEGRDMLNFCSTSGPLFIIGAAGAGMLGSSAAGYMMLAAHCVGALITGMMMNPGSALNRLTRETPRPKKAGALLREKYGDSRESDSPGAMQAASDAVLRSLRTMGLIGGFIVIFTIITEYAAIAGDAAAAVLLSGAPGARGASEIIRHVTTAISGLLEMTVGCSRVSGLNGVGMNVKMTLCAFLISFGGLSVAAQTAGVLRGSGLRLSEYMCAKLMHGLISSALIVVFIMARDILFG